MAGTLEERVARLEDEARRFEAQKQEFTDAVGTRLAANQNAIDAVVNDARAEFANVHANLQTLFAQTNTAVEELQRRLTELEKNSFRPSEATPDICR